MIDNLLSEFMSGVFKEASKYAQLLRRNIVPEIDRKVAGVILRYLVANSSHPSKCTIRAIERETGIAFSRIRKVAQILLDEKILDRVTVGRASYLRIVNLEEAISRGYLDVSSRDILTYLILSIPPPTFGTSLDGLLIVNSMPRVPLPIKSVLEFAVAWSAVESLSFMYAEIFYELRNRGLKPVKNNREIDKIIEQYLKKRYKNFEKTLPKKELDRVLSITRIRSIVEIIFRYNMEDAIVHVGGKILELPLWRLAMLPTPMEIFHLKEVVNELKARNELPQNAEPLPHASILPLSRILSIFYLSATRLQKPITHPFEGCRLIIKTLLEIYIEFLGNIVKSIEDNGVTHFESLKPRGFWTPSQLLFEALIMKYAILLAASSGVDLRLIHRGAEIAYSLENIVQQINSHGGN